MKNKNHEPQTTRYLPIIGLEVHVELKTKSKMFCCCSAEYFGHKPNTHCCPVCLGLPGALPVPNKTAIEWCVKIGLALNCDIPLLSKFDRKNYFYPDLPKGYQISQYDQPFAINGWIDIAGSTWGVARGKENHEPQATRHKRIRIRRVHMEEDTAKLTHAPSASLIDFNRSGVPLVEIVTEPDFTSGTEVKEYLQKLQQIVRYLGVSDADMEKGEMRLEPNISLARSESHVAGSKNHEPQPTNHLPPYKVEVKNINSFRFVEKAIDYEIKRQLELLQKGQSPIQETRGWDEKKQITVSQRTKEEAHDYRYFPEPDIPPIRWTKSQIRQLADQIPELPDQKFSRFQKEYGLSVYDAEILTREENLANYFDEAARVNEKLKMRNEKCTNAKAIANWIINKKVDINKILPAELIQALLSATQTTTISHEELEKIIAQVLLENPKAVEDYKKGKETAIMFLVGQTMRKSKEKLDASTIKEKLIEKIKYA